MDTINDYIQIEEMYEEEKYVKRFFFGFVLYLLTYLSAYIRFIPGNIINMVQLIGLIFIFYYAIKLISISNIENKYFRMQMFLFLLWELYIVLRNYSLSYMYLKEYLFEPYQFLHYFIPVVVLFPLSKSPFFIERLFKVFVWFGKLFVVLLPLYFIFYSQYFAEQYIWILATGCGFIILTLPYHSKRTVILSYIVVSLSLILMTIMARRNIMFTFFNYLLLSFLLFFFSTERALGQKIIVFILSLIVVFSAYQLFISDSSGTFSNIKARASQDTREIVILAFFADMEESHFLIGKGLDGSYYCPGIDEAFIGMEITHRDADYRDTIENGFLQMILKGGVIYVLLFLLIAIPAIIKGYFYSNNMLSKASASIVFLWILDMIPFGLPVFSIRYLLFWVCIAICYSETIRNMENEEVHEIINS